MASRVIVYLCLICLSLTPSNVEAQFMNNYFNGVKNVMSSLRNYFHSGLEGLAKLAETIETIEQYVDATIDEDCEPFVCPAGLVRVPNRNHLSVSNGCGSFGFEWKEDALPHSELKECCNVHDYCYDHCGADKDICDLQFKRCLYKVCASKDNELTLLNMKACKGTAKLMYTGTLALGCKAFQDAQRQACQCVPNKEL